MARGANGMSPGSRPADDARRQGRDQRLARRLGRHPERHDGLRRQALGLAEQSERCRFVNLELTITVAGAQRPVGAGGYGGGGMVPPTRAM